MTNQILVVLSLLFAGLPSIVSLYCYNGANVHVPPLLDMYTLNSTKCEDVNARCLVGDLTYTVFGFVKGKIC